MQNNAWIDYLAWGLVGGNQWGCDIIRKFLWVGAPSFAVATCKIMGWGNNRTTKVAKHRGGKKCACLHMHKKMTYLSRLFQEIRVCLIIKLPSNWMMDNEYALNKINCYNLPSRCWDFQLFLILMQKCIYFRHVQIILHQKRAKNVTLNATFAWVICLLP